MPIASSIPARRLSKKEFGEIAYEVMNHVFAIHGEFGRFFDESIYKKELAKRMNGVSLEAYVDATHGSFFKRYFADVIVGAGALFEFKAVEALHSKHRSQTLHYLLLFDLAHGKLVNMRTAAVQHEFVNCHFRSEELRQPSIKADQFDATLPGAQVFRDTLLSLINDWGSGFELSLYEDALTHFFGGEPLVHRRVPVHGTTGQLGEQFIRLVVPEAAFRLTALTDERETFASHVHRLLRHMPLRAIHWANITRNEITFSTLA